MRLDHAFWPDVEKYLEDDDRLLLPVGSVEQHGPAVATGIDYIIAEAVAAAAAERLDVYCAPPLCYGMSLHHAAFAGTVSLMPAGYLHMLTELLSFFVTHGFRRVVVVNGHGGNVPTLRNAAMAVAYEHEGVRVAVSNWYEPAAVQRRIGELFGDAEGSHVTPSEVSVLMYLRPELVGDLAAVEKTAPGRITWAPGPADLREHYPQGAVGSTPRLASAAAGEELFALAVAGVVDMVEKL